MLFPRQAFKWLSVNPRYRRAELSVEVIKSFLLSFFPVLISLQILFFFFNPHAENFLWSEQTYLRL